MKRVLSRHATPTSSERGSLTKPRQEGRSTGVGAKRAISITLLAAVVVAALLAGALAGRASLTGRARASHLTAQPAALPVRGDRWELDAWARNGAAAGTEAQALPARGDRWEREDWARRAGVGAGANVRGDRWELEPWARNASSSGGAASVRGDRWELEPWARHGPWWTCPSTWTCSGP
jgi:hypothetical protein